MLTAEVPQPAAPRDIEAASSAAVAPAEAAPVAAPPLEETPAGISSETGYKVGISCNVVYIRILIVVPQLR